MVAISQFVNKRLLVGGSLSVTPMLSLYLITDEQKFVIGSIISISFFYMLITDPKTKKTLVAMLATYAISIALFLFEKKQSPMALILLISISFLPILFRIFNLNKSTGMYASVSILFFSIPISANQASNAVLDQNTVSILFAISALPGIIVGILLSTSKTKKPEREYEKPSEIILELLPLIISTTICAAISTSISNYDVPMLMWSCIVVNSCKLENSQKKIKERLIPGVLGIIIGYILGILLKEFRFSLLISSYATMLSLVALKNYSLGFFIRCVLFPVTVCALYQDDHEIYMRLSEIFIGGGVSISSVFLVTFFHKELARVTK
ncbi:FUSC family protein [Serratia marcescens]|uniref:FUSC family protein n=1 Tax=Serratia marcescens TaxID=615 RepID=UPI000ADD2ED3|nr:FUSC family protein [Serratia marcescens]